MDPDHILADDFINRHPYQAAQVLEELQDVEVAEFIQELPTGNALTLLNFMDPFKTANCFALFPSDFCTTLFEESDLALAESIIRQLDEPMRLKILTALSPDRSNALKRKLEQMPNTVGMFMVPIAAVKIDMLVSDAIVLIKKIKEGLGCYLSVVGSEGSLEGIVRLEKLLLADHSSPITSIMTTAIPKFYADMPLIGIVNHPAWYEYNSIPIVDGSERLLGALPYSRTQELKGKKEGQLTKDLLETSTALGELYRIGLTGVLQSVGK